MVEQKIELHKYDIELELERVKGWSIPNVEKKRIIEFVKEFISGRVNNNKPTIATAKSLLCMLRTSLEFINKDSTKLSKKDIIIYSDNLAQDKIKKNVQGRHFKGLKSYKEAVKLRIKYSLAIYLKWVLKEKSAEFVEILKIKPRIKKSSVDFLTEEKVLRLLNNCKNEEERFLLAVLFDGGFRAEEFYNIRREDIEIPKEAKYYRIHIKNEYSKTEGRVVSMMWYKSYEIIQDYLNKRISEGMKAEEQVFALNYRTARDFLYRLGLRVLGRKLYFHLFRHSSATFYASKLNRQQLCMRYGWAFSSKMPDTYIARSGVDMVELEDKADNIERIQVKQENDRLKTEMSILQERIKKLTEETSTRLVSIEETIKIINQLSNLGK